MVGMTGLVTLISTLVLRQSPLVHNQSLDPYAANT
jgi:hypothetical protein